MACSMCFAAVCPVHCMYLFCLIDVGDMPQGIPINLVVDMANKLLNLNLNLMAVI